MPFSRAPNSLFIIGGWTHTWPDSCHSDSSCMELLWPWVEALGLNFIRPQIFGSLVGLDALTSSGLRQPEQKLVLTPADAVLYVYTPGFGMELELFCFDREGGGDTSTPGMPDLCPLAGALHPWRDGGTVIQFS